VRGIRGEVAGFELFPFLSGVCHAPQFTPFPRVGNGSV
jgi:hypothetical protein